MRSYEAIGTGMAALGVLFWAIPPGQAGYLVVLFLTSSVLLGFQMWKRKSVNVPDANTFRERLFILGGIAILTLSSIAFFMKSYSVGI